MPRAKSTQTKQKRKDWEINHALITEAYLSLVKERLRAPTVQEVADMLGLTWDTVRKHVDELRFTPSTHPLRILTDKVIISIAQSAMEGNPGSQKLWMQLMEGWGEKTTNLNVDLAQLTTEQLLRLRNGEALESVLSTVQDRSGVGAQAKGGDGETGQVGRATEAGTAEATPTEVTPVSWISRDSSSHP